MKKLFTLFTILFIFAKLSASADALDSLRQQLKVTTADSLRGPLYAQIAAEYLKYDTISNPIKKMMYQNEAIINSCAALHVFSKYDDTTGLRTCFDNLATVYYYQKKYSQAKWFVLQSNNLSRLKNDTANVIASLVKLAAIKTDLKEYSLATKDLNEALLLSQASKTATSEATVQKSYAKMYTKMNKKGKAAIALKKSKLIVADSIRVSQAPSLAKANPDTSKTKKKFTANNKKINVITSKKIATL